MAQATASQGPTIRWPKGPIAGRVWIGAAALALVATMATLTAVLWPGPGSDEARFDTSMGRAGGAGGDGAASVGKDASVLVGGIEPSAPAFEESVADDEARSITLSQAPARSIVSTAGVSLEVTSIAPALTQLRVIAEGQGGFLEHLSSSGGATASHASASVRVPGDRFFETLDQIKALGAVTSEQAGSSDVTDQIIDLGARLTSERRTEESLLGLLNRAESVNDVLTIERELTRVRSSIERLEAQQQSLERSVALATIAVSLATPAAAEPSSASLALDVGDAQGALASIRSAIELGGGTVSDVSIEERAGGDPEIQIHLVAEVPGAELPALVDFVDGLGDVRSKIVRSPGGKSVGTEAVAPISVTLVQRDGGLSLWILAGAPAGGTALVLLLAAGAYALGRRRVA